MNLADAYPNSDISAGAMTAIALVMVGCMAIWLVMVLWADRPTTRKAPHRPISPTPPAPRAPQEDLAAPLTEPAKAELVKAGPVKAETANAETAQVN